MEKYFPISRVDRDEYLETARERRPPAESLPQKTSENPP